MKNKVPVILCIVLAIVMVISGVVFFVSTSKNPASSEEKNPEPVEFVFEQSEYSTSGALSVKGANGEVYLPTDFENVYYTATLDGSNNHTASSTTVHPLTSIEDYRALSGK